MEATTVLHLPGVCQGCRKHVWYNGKWWTDKDGLGHLCVNRPKRDYRSWMITPKGVRHWIKG